MKIDEAQAFPTHAALEQWLKSNHAMKSELWVRIYKKDSGTPSVDWNAAVARRGSLVRWHFDDNTIETLMPEVTW